MHRQGLNSSVPLQLSITKLTNKDILINTEKKSDKRETKENSGIHCYLVTKPPYLPYFIAFGMEVDMIVAVFKTSYLVSSFFVKNKMIEMMRKHFA